MIFLQPCMRLENAQLMLGIHSTGRNMIYPNAYMVTGDNPHTNCHILENVALSIIETAHPNDSWMGL